MKIFSLLETQYYNFTSSVKDYLSKTLSNFGETYGNSTIFGQLINVLSGVVQNMMLYIEDSLTEQNKWTAQRKKSIYGLASQSGYEPSYGKAAGVQLKLSFTPSFTQSLNVIIQNREQLTCTQNGLQYNIILPQESITLNLQKSSNKYLYAVEGRFESQSFISEGGKYWTKNFQFVGNVDVDYMYVTVNDELWEYVPSLYDMDADGKQYTYKVGYTGGIDLIFGNDVHGRALKNNDVVKVTYLIHNGADGNINTHEETYFVFDNSLSDISGSSVDGNNIFNVTFSTQDSVTSGANAESLDSVRNNIGFNSRALVLSSPENYKEYLSKFTFVGYNRTWSEPGSMIVNTLAMKNYKLNLEKGRDYFNLTKESDLLLSDVQKQSIINSIKNSGRMLAGVTYNIIDPEICKYYLSVYIKLKPNASDKIFIEAQIRDLIGDFFANIYSDQFIPKSDIEKLILDNIKSVESVNCYFLSEKNETAIQKRQYTINTYKWNPATGKYDIKTETVYLQEGENPGLGLDAHGNIELSSDHEFPALMGDWDWLNDNEEEVTVSDPLNIIFE